MKKISQMSLPELRTLALETDKLDVLWDIMTNCKDDPCTIQNIVSNPLTRFNAKLVRMAYDKGDTRVQITIARHTVDSSIIDDAACSDNRSVRANAALNPNINLPTLIRLSQDSWWGVRVNAFSNSQSKNNILSSICHNNADMSVSIPDYNKLPLAELRDRAVETENLEELWAIMENCKDDAHTIQKIIENPCTRYDPKLIRLAYDKGDARVQITIARHTVDQSIINEAAISSNRSVRCSAALNPNISMETMKNLSKDTWWGVRASLLSNEKITREFVRTIYDNDSDFTIRTLARELLDKMAQF